MSKRDLDLNALKIELRNAYVKKALETQIRERETEREIEKIRDNYSHNLARVKNLEFEKRVKKREAELERKRESYKRELEDQMKVKDRAKKVENEEAIKERKLLEESDRIVDEEELNFKMRTKRELAERLQREKIIFQEIKEIRKREEAQALRDETKKNEMYLEELEERKRELKTLEEEQKKRREKLINRVAEMLVNLESKNLTKQSKIADLVAEEMSWELVIQERQDEIRRQKLIKELVEDLKEQIRYKEESTRRSLERDRAFADMVMKRVMEDEKIEKLTNEAKIRNRITYKEDLIRIMKEREKIRQMEKERIKIEIDREKEIEEIRKTNVFENRKQLLLQHAQTVASYVNESKLTDEEKCIVDEAKNSLNYS